MCDVDGQWRPAASIANLRADGPAISPADAVGVIGLAGHMVTAAGVVLLHDDTPLPRTAAYAVDCGATSSLELTGALVSAGSGGLADAVGSECVATQPLSPSLATSTVCADVIRTGWRGVPPQSWVSQVAARPPFSTSRYAVATWSSLQEVARRPVQRYRLLAISAVLVADGVQSLVRDAVNASCRVHTVPRTTVAVFTSSEPLQMSLPQTRQRPAGMYPVVPVAGVSVAAVEAGIINLDAETGVMTWNVTAAALQLAVLHDAASQATANATARAALNHTLDSALMLVALLAEGSSADAGCNLVHVMAAPVGGWTVLSGGTAVSSAGVVASSTEGALRPQGQAHPLGLHLIDLRSTCSSVVAAVVDAAAILLPPTASSRRLQTGATASSSFRRMLVGAALSESRLELHFSSRPAEQETVATSCRVMHDASNVFSLTGANTTVTASSYAAVRGVVTVGISASPVLPGGQPVIAATLACSVTSESAGGATVYATTALSVPLLALSIVLPVAGDLVLANRDGAVRSAWSTTSLPLATWTGQDVGGSNSSTNSVLASLQPDLATSIAHAVSIQPPPPGATFRVVFNGQTSLLLVAASANATEGSIPARFSAGSTVTLGSANGTMSWVSPDGRVALVVTPPYAAACQGRSASVCDRLPLTITPPPLPSPAEISSLALGGPDATAVEAALLSGERSLSLPIACPPFCPGVAGGVALHMAGVEGSGTINAVAGLPPPIPFAGRLMQVVPAGRSATVIGSVGGAGTALAQSSGISYVESCSVGGFEDPTSGVCTNSSDPRALRCALGRWVTELMATGAPGGGGGRCRSPSPPPSLDLVSIVQRGLVHAVPTRSAVSRWQRGHPEGWPLPPPPRVPGATPLS